MPVPSRQVVEEGLKFRGLFLYVVVLCCSFTCHGFMNLKKTNILFTDGLKGMKDEGVVKYTLLRLQTKISRLNFLLN